MKDSQSYILIKSLQIRYSPWIGEDGTPNKLQEGKYRSFILTFNPNIDRICMLIHFKHLEVYRMKLYYRKKSAKNRKIKKIYPQHKMKLIFDNTVGLLTYLTTKNYKIDCFEIRFTNGWTIKSSLLYGLEFITNNTIERDSLIENLVNISGQGPIDINSLKINETYTLSTNGKINHKPLF